MKKRDKKPPLSIRREKGVAGLKPLAKVGGGRQEPNRVKLLNNEFEEKGVKKARTFIDK